MSKLNNRDWVIRVRRGVVADFPLLVGMMWEGELAYTTDEKQLFIGDENNNPQPVGVSRLALAGVAGNASAIVPAGYVIDDIFIRETAGNAVTGGIKIGTTAGGTEITASIAVGANSFTRTFPATLTTSGPFSPTATQTIFFQAVTAWNSAIVDIVVRLKRAII
jgi:hypothetical protein